MHKRMAVLVDGGFFRKRLRTLYPSKFWDTPEAAAKTLHKMVMAHVDKDDLYKIFYYDCPPLSKKAHNPVTKKAVDFSKTELANFMQPYLLELKRMRKLALRLGHLDEDNAQWQFSSETTKRLLNGQMKIEDIKETDVTYYARQKGVDMMIGVDISTLALKQLVGKIVLIAGDSDFVPASKLARREGIDFILDPMWNRIRPDLYEHIDGLKSWAPNPDKKKLQGKHR